MKMSDGVDFDSWFDAVAVIVNDETGVTFRDQDSVREDFDADKEHEEVADDIIAEYRN